MGLLCEAEEAIEGPGGSYHSPASLVRSQERSLTPTPKPHLGSPPSQPCTHLSSVLCHPPDESKTLALGLRTWKLKIG